MDEPVRLCIQRQQVLQSRDLVLGPQRAYVRDSYLLRGVLCPAVVATTRVYGRVHDIYDHDHMPPEAFKR